MVSLACFDSRMRWSVFVVSVVGSFLFLSAAAPSGTVEFHSEFVLVSDSKLEAHVTSRHHPTRRYGAGMTYVPKAVDSGAPQDLKAMKGTLVVTQGYNYDHPTHTPLWLDEVWSFDLETRQWSRKATTEETDRAAPAGIYKHTTVYYGKLLVHFGGDDGGHLINKKTHVWGSFSNALRILNVASWHWSLV